MSPLEPRWVYGPVVHPIISIKRPPKIERGEDDGGQTPGQG